MVGHARKVSRAEQAAETEEQQRKIRAERVQVNMRVWREFNTRGLRSAWEFVHGPMPPPNFEVEPTAFCKWLGVTRGGARGSLDNRTELEIAVYQKLHPT